MTHLLVKAVTGLLLQVGQKQLLIGTIINDSRRITYYISNIGYAMYMSIIIMDSLYSKAAIW